MSAIELYKQPAEVVKPLDDWIPVLSQVVELANQIAGSPFVPDGLRGSVPAVAAAILTGREMGLGPMTSLANIHVIKGKTGLSALLMRALIQSQGHEWQDVEVTDTRVIVRGRRKGETEWAEASFNVNQAKQAGIHLGGYPQDKLYARATVRLARRKFADVIAGMPYSAEELEDGELEQTSETTEPPPTAAATPAPKTAQRRPRAAKPVHVDKGEQGINLPPDQPPLPGEDDPPKPDKVPGWVGVIVQHFNRLGIEDRDERLTMTRTIAGRGEPLSSTKDLTELERKRVSDTLSRCRDHGQLIALMTEGDKP